MRSIGIFATVLATGLLLASCTRQGIDTDAGGSAEYRPAQSAALSVAGTSPSTATRRTRFAALPDRGELLRYDTKAPIADGAYTWHRAELSEQHALDAIGHGTLRVIAPDGRALGFRYDRSVRHDESGNWTWIGHLIEHEGVQAILTFGRDAAYGSIGQPDALPLRLVMQGGASWLVETDPTRLDGVPDVAIADDARSPGLPIPAALGFRGAAASDTTAVMPASRHIDANGNGASDLFFFNHSSGSLVTWYMNGMARTAYSTSAIPAAQHVVGTGNFSDDRRGDLFLAGSDGTLYLGISNGATFAEQALPYTIVSRAIAAGDFDGNGKTDILLLDGSARKITTWFMVNGSRVAYTSQTLPSGLRFITVGDFNGDLLDDLLFEGAQGSLYIAMSRGTIFQMRAILSHGSDYSVRGVTDVDGDGRADILLHSTALNRLVVWYMDGLTRTAYNSMDSPAGAMLVADGDFDHNGRGDVGWVHPTSGKVWLSLSTGTAFTTTELGYSYAPTTVDAMDIPL